MKISILIHKNNIHVFFFVEIFFFELEVTKVKMSLRDLLKDRIVDQIINESKKQMKKKYTLIVGDEHTIKILDHCFKMHELNDLNVGVVLNVKYPRERVKLPPIYFLSNDYESTKAMVKDYENLNQLQYHGPVQIFYCQSYVFISIILRYIPFESRIIALISILI